MKFIELNLRAIGPFTDKQLNLGDSQQGLRIIYGPNEAGKSSALRAITYLLYGFPQKIPDNFIHPYPQLRIGATLQHSDGNTLDIVRRKSKQNSLRQSDDIEVVEESELGRLLGEVDRDLFQVMFGIDHDRLRQGGDEIVKGGGQIGELLFAAGAGLADLHQVQADLRDEIDQLFKSGGSKNEIAQKSKEFEGVRGELEEAQVSVETWIRHDEALTNAQAEKSRIDELILSKRAEQNRLTRIQNAISAIGQWKRTTKELIEFSDAVLLSDDFAVNSNNLLIKVRTAEQQEKDAQDACSKIDEQLKTLSLPEELLREADAIELLRDRLGGYRKAMTDRPKLETSRLLLEQEAKDTLLKLGRESDLSTIEELRLPTDKTIRIQNLGNRREGLNAKRDAARRDCDRLRREIARCQNKLKEIQVPADAANLKSTLREIQQLGDLETQRDQIRDQLDRRREDTEIQRSQLPLWSGDLEQLEKLAVPSLKTIEQFDDQLKTSEARLQSIRDRLAAEQGGREELEKQLTQLELEQAIPTKEQLQAKRESREKGWQLILKAWQQEAADDSAAAAFLEEYSPSQDLADAYHRSVEEADNIADLLRNDAERVATKVKLQADRELRIAKESTLMTELEQAQSQADESENRWQAAWESLGIKPLTPLEMRDWFHQQQATVEAVADIRRQGRDLEQLEQRVSSVTEELLAALMKIDPTFENECRLLRELLQIASAKSDEIQRSQSLLEQLNEKLETDQENLDQVESQLAEAEAELQNWQRDWSAEMSRLGLEDQATPAQANSRLNDIGVLFDRYKDADQLRTRIDSIDRDANDFEVDVRGLCRRVGSELTDKPLVEVIGILATQLQHARASKEQHGSLLQQRSEQQEKQRKARDNISAFKASLDEMCRQAKCSSHEQLSDAARKSEQRRVLENTRRDLEEQITSQSGGTEFDTFIAAVEAESADVDSLQPRIDELDKDIGQLGKERDEFVRQVEREETELGKIDGSTVAAEKATECESIASQLEEQVRELAVLRVASKVLHTGIENYRKKNQSPVLGRASEIFQEITLGAFDRLQTDYSEGNTKVLTGVRATDGTTVLVSGMSDGTCDQLYLALRLASLESWLEHHEPIPFIVDDVLLHFDDDRAIATLKVLAQISRRCQIIFFTHHQHLVDMAKDSLSAKDFVVTSLEQNK